MNYLAHAYLSFGNTDILTGNLISDFVKGKRKLEYPAPIRMGISLHRAIDEFTDTHPVTQRAKSFFRADYRLYSGPLTDIAYDHFLAGDPALFPTPGDLSAFAQQSYAQLATRSAVFPDKFARLFPFMREQDWFTGYRSNTGIFASFGGLTAGLPICRRLKGPAGCLNTIIMTCQDCYRRFFPALKDFAVGTLRELFNASY